VPSTTSLPPTTTAVFVSLALKDFFYPLVGVGHGWVNSAIGCWHCGGCGTYASVLDIGVLSRVATQCVSALSCGSYVVVSKVFTMWTCVVVPFLNGGNRKQM
jgi:hypothetical protein